MSYRYSNSRGNYTFRSGSTSSIGPTVISAIQKLKQQSQQILRQHKRYRVLNHQISRENIKHINTTKQQMFFTAVKQSAEVDKEVKKQCERKKIEEVKQKFAINIKQREHNKQLIQNVKRSFTNVNHQTYENIRQKRKENQQLIHARRSFVLQSRAANRKRLEQEEKSRRKSIQNFYDSRVATFRQKKEEEIKEILQKSEEKHRFAQALSSRNSRIRENKLQDSRSISNRSLRNPESIEVQA